MRATINILFASMVVVIFLAMQTASAQDTVEEMNKLPNPYKRIYPWAEMPTGLSWGQVIGVEPGPDGNLYVLHRCFEGSCIDRDEPPILVFEPSGEFVRGWGEGLFIRPHGFHIDPEGNVWTTDDRAHVVFKFSAHGELLMTLGRHGVSGDGPNVFDQPTDVLVAPNGNLFVTNGHGMGANRVMNLAGDGTFIKAWGSTGTGEGEFDIPHALAMDSQGRLFVGDRNNARIQIFDQNGEYIDQWTQFGRPSGLFITPDDTLYVADNQSFGVLNPGVKKGIRVGSAQDGALRYLIEDLEATSLEEAGAEGVGVDVEGNVYGAVVRRMMLEKHERL